MLYVLSCCANISSSQNTLLQRYVRCANQREQGLTREWWSQEIDTTMRCLRVRDFSCHAHATKPCFTHKRLVDAKVSCLSLLRSSHTEPWTDHPRLALPLRVVLVVSAAAGAALALLVVVGAAYEGNLRLDVGSATGWLTS